MAVSLSVAHRHASLPIAYRLYLPEAWAGDAARRIKAKIPEDVAFQTKPEIALGQIAAARAEGDAEPSHYWFSTLPAETDLTTLVDIAKLR